LHSVGKVKKLSAVLLKIKKLKMVSIYKNGGILKRSLGKREEIDVSLAMFRKPL
jgi:hypothetical protein